MNKKVNILLFLSDYKKIKNEGKPHINYEEEYCLAGTEHKVLGAQTNDAPTRFLIEQIEKKGDYLRRVICISSYKVLTEPEDEPQIKRYEKFIKKEYDLNNDVELMCIPYDYDENTKARRDYGNELPLVIYEKLSNCFKEIDDDEEVYIDYTGGFRDISFLMTAIIRFLEYRGLKCGEIVYSKFPEKKLYDIHYIYDMYQLFNGVNEFTNTGNAKELVKTYVGDDKAIRLINSLTDFSNALGICDIAHVDECIELIKCALKNIESDDSMTDINSMMLKTLAPIIREKMYLDEKYNYPKMIKWCVENNMIQQAATIYTDKMPKYYFGEMNFIPDFVDTENITIPKGHELYETAFYTELYDRIAEGLEVADFRKLLKEISIEDAVSKKEVIELIRQKSNEVDNEFIFKAFGRLELFISRCFENSRQNKRHKYNTTSSSLANIKLKSNYDYRLYRVFKYDANNNNADDDGYIKVKYNEKKVNLKNFWDSLTSSNVYWLHRFLFNEESEYLSIANKKSKNYRTDTTYRKKAFAVKRLSCDSFQVGKDVEDSGRHNLCINNYKELSKVMAYYLAVKIMRNRMNHAGEKDRTYDEIQAINSLNEMDMGIDFKDDIEAYKRILLCGIAILENGE